MTYTCIKCLADTDNDCDICDDCAAESDENNGGLLARAQAFVDRKYVARADERQKSMGLAYVEAERQDLAREIVHFVEGLGVVAPQPSCSGVAALPGEPTQALIDRMTASLNYDGLPPADALNDADYDHDMRKAYRALHAALFDAADTRRTARGAEPVVTDEMVDRAVETRTSLIQGFSYSTHNAIVDYRTDYGLGVTVWTSPATADREADSSAMNLELERVKMRVVLTAALSPPRQERGGAR